MIEVTILDKDLTFVGRIDNYESLVFSKELAKAAEFTITINKSKKHTDKLIVDNYIMLGTDTRKTGVILKVEYEEDKTDTVTITGETLETFLSRRITIPPAGKESWTMKAPTETVIKSLIDANFNAAADQKRHINNLVIATDQQRGPTMEWASRYENLNEEIETICNSAQMGVVVELDYKNKKFIVDVIQGTDKTKQQTERNWVVFNEKLDNIGNRKFTHAKQDLKTLAYSAGQGEGTEREVVEVGSGEGIDRREIFIDARDLAETAQIIERGQQSLDEAAEIITFEGMPLAISNFKYGKHYNLGDFVTVENIKWGVTINAQVTAVQESWEQSYRLEVNFGSKIPTLQDKIKRMIKGSVGQ